LETVNEINVFFFKHLYLPTNNILQLIECFNSWKNLWNYI